MIYNENTFIHIQLWTCLQFCNILLDTRHRNMLSVVRVILYIIHLPNHINHTKSNQKYNKLIKLFTFYRQRKSKNLFVFLIVGTAIIIIIIANRPIETNIENVDNDVCEYMFSTRIVCVVTYLNVENSFIFWQPNDYKMCFCFTNEINISSCFWSVVYVPASINLFFYFNLALLYFISIINA